MSCKHPVFAAGEAHPASVSGTPVVLPQFNNGASVTVPWKPSSQCHFFPVIQWNIDPETTQEARNKSE